jgi:hypothetical protein
MSSAVEQKVLTIFRELAGDRTHQLQIAIPAAQQVLADALTGEHPVAIARDIAFHLTDWQSEAAFLVAVLLFPERFTPEEIREGVEAFMVHAPNHTAAAAKLGGFPVTDVFDVGALDGGQDA